MNKREKAAMFFLHFALADCEKIAIENPVGHMSKAYRSPDQIIQPYYFAESENDEINYWTKQTCLWVKGIPLLKRKYHLPKPKPIRSYIQADGTVKNVCWEMVQSGRNQKERALRRSKTFPGIARAMAEQWAGQA